MADSIAGVLGDEFDGGDRFLVCWMPIANFSWVARESLLLDPATQQLMNEYLDFVHRPFLEAKEPTPGRPRFERGTHVLINYMLGTHVTVLPAVVRDVASDDSLSIHLVGWLPDRDGTLSETSERLGKLVSVEHTGVLVGENGKWRTLVWSADPTFMEELAPPALEPATHPAPISKTSPKPSASQKPLAPTASKSPRTLKAAAPPVAEVGAPRSGPSTPSTRAAPAGAGEPFKSGAGEPRVSTLGASTGVPAMAPGYALFVPSEVVMEMALVDLAMGDSSYFAAEKSISGDRAKERKGGLPRRESCVSSLADEAFHRKISSRANFEVGSRLLRLYHNNVWYRATITAFDKDTGRISIVYDEDGAEEDLTLPNPHVLLLGTIIHEPSAQPTGPMPACASGAATSPLSPGDALVCEQGRLWVVTKALANGYVELRSRSGTRTIRHTSEMWRASEAATADFQHYVTPEQDISARFLSTRLDVDAKALVAANKRSNKGMHVNSPLWKGTVLLLPAPSATAASVESALAVKWAEDRSACEASWSAVRRRGGAQPVPQKQVQKQAALPPGAAGKRPLPRGGKVGAKRAKSEPPGKGALPPSRAQGLPASKPTGKNASELKAGHASQLLRGSKQGGNAHASSSRAAGEDAGQADEGGATERLLRVFLLSHADGSGTGKPTKCIGAVVVLAGMTLGELAKSISDECGAQPGFTLTVGDIPIHKKQYSKQAMPFAEGSGSATIAYSVDPRVSQLVPGTVLPQYAVEYRPPAQPQPQLPFGGMTLQKLQQQQAQQAQQAQARGAAAAVPAAAAPAANGAAPAPVPAAAPALAAAAPAAAAAAAAAATTAAAAAVAVHVPAAAAGAAASAAAVVAAAPAAVTAIAAAANGDAMEVDSAVAGAAITAAAVAATIAAAATAAAAATGDGTAEAAAAKTVDVESDGAEVAAPPPVLAATAPAPAPAALAAVVSSPTVDVATSAAAPVAASVAAPAERAAEAVGAGASELQLGGAQSPASLPASPAPAEAAPCGAASPVTYLA
mmetsp:Transcript_39673/g.91899  ORF Transcript_39673/g.91899 Transcript_39673/m.91899 type:complete len:1028 (-) Transcript_39673:57-3140(-)